MKKTYNEIIQEFINDTLFLRNYTKTENMQNQSYDAKLTVKIGKRIEKNLQIILQADEGIVAFKNLLAHPELYIRFISARYLYPILPQKAITIMKEYMDTLSDRLERYEVENVIKGLKNKQAVFISQFKKLYGVNFEKYCVFNQEEQK